MMRGKCRSSGTQEWKARYDNLPGSQLVQDVSTEVRLRLFLSPEPRQKYITPTLTSSAVIMTSMLLLPSP